MKLPCSEFRVLVSPDMDAHEALPLMRLRASCAVPPIRLLEAFVMAMPR